MLDGDNAIAGVINIITKSPSGKFNAGGGITLGSYDRYRVDAHAGGGYDKMAVSFYSSQESSDGYRANNDYRANDFGGKFVLDQRTVSESTCPDPITRTTSACRGP